MALDIPTLVIIASVTFAIEALSSYLQWRLISKFDGLRNWLLGTILLAVGFLFMLAIRIRPALDLSVLAGPVVIAGQLFLCTGVARFLGHRERPWVHAACYAAFFLPYLYCALAVPGAFVRSMLAVLAATLLAMRSGWLLLRHGGRSYRQSAVFTGTAFFLYSCAQAVAMAIALSRPGLASSAQPDAGPGAAMNLLAPIVTSLLWASGFVIMVNQRLNGEIKEEKEKLDMAFSLSPEAELLTRFSDGRIVIANSAFLSLTGFAPEEMMGRSIREIGVLIEDAEWTRFIAGLYGRGSVDGLEYPFRRKDGSVFQGRISCRTMPMDGQLHVLTVVEDITARKQAERKVQDLLAEKELILKEVHHRIKNNMSTVHSLLSLQAGIMQAPEAAEALRDAASRVESMAVLYDRLYRSGSFDELPVADYLSSLVDEIARNFPNAGEVRIVKEFGDFRLGARTLQLLGIIVNELLTNAMKYAFAGKGDCELAVSASFEGGIVNLAVADNGKGMAGNIGNAGEQGFGLMLIDAIAKQLEGTIRIAGGSGTRVVLAFRP